VLIGLRRSQADEVAPGSRPAEREAPRAAQAARTARVVRWLPPAALAAGFVAVVLVNLRVPVPADEVHYMQAAAWFPHPLSAVTLHRETRFGLVLPMRPAIAVFGYSQAAYHVVPILASLILLLGTYVLGTQLFSRPVGVAAAVVVVTSAPVFAEAEDPLPDVFAAGLFTVAVAMALAIRRRRLEPRWWVLVGLGLVLGWSYLVREFVVFVWPLIPILLFRRVGWRRLLLVGAPIVALVIGETLLCWLVYDNPLTRIHAITHHAEGPMPARVAQTFRDKPRHVYLLRFPLTLVDYPGGGWLLALLTLTLVGGLVSVLRTLRRFAIFAIWCALLWVPLTLLGGLLDPHQPKLRLQLLRYWFPIFPAFVLGGLGLLWLAGCALRGRLRARGPALARLAAALPLVMVLGSARGRTAGPSWRRSAPGCPSMTPGCGRCGRTSARSRSSGSTGTVHSAAWPGTPPPRSPPLARPLHRATWSCSSTPSPA
jgi:4-amino-4-deoxy-L-arabinose transferase-like glycosyltransferase